MNKSFFIYSVLSFIYLNLFANVYFFPQFHDSRDKSFIESEVYYFTDFCLNSKLNKNDEVACKRSFEYRNTVVKSQLDALKFIEKLSKESKPLFILAEGRFEVMSKVKCLSQNTYNITSLTSFSIDKIFNKTALTELVVKSAAEFFLCSKQNKINQIYPGEYQQKSQASETYYQFLQLMDDIEFDWIQKGNDPKRLNAEIMNQLIKTKNPRLHSLIFSEREKKIRQAVESIYKSYIKQYPNGINVFILFGKAHTFFDDFANFPLEFKRIH